MDYLTMSSPKNFNLISFKRLLMGHLILLWANVFKTYIQLCFFLKKPTFFYKIFVT